MVEGCDASPSGCERHCLILVLGGIIRVVFDLKTWWAPNVGSQSLKALTANIKAKSAKVWKGHENEKCMFVLGV
jgi:hypothetical protein